MKRIIKVNGMTCGHCVKRVESNLNAVDGVTAKVSLDEETATVSLSKDVDDLVLIQAVENAGYEVDTIKGEIEK